MGKENIMDILQIDPANLKAYSSGLLQGKAYNRMHSHLSRVLLQFNISVPEWKLLGQLHAHGAVRLALLADLLSYDPPMVTKLAKLLEKKQLVKRVQDEKDERAKVITITSSGNMLIEAIEPQVKKTMALILKGVSYAELRTYIKVLSIIVNNTQE